MNVLIHHILKLFHVLDPLILNSVWEASEYVVAVLHATREDLVDFLILGFVIDEIEHVNSPARLTKALDAPEPLF